MQKVRGHSQGAPTVCRHRVSGSLSPPSSGYFSPFPHGTRSLSVTREYLALDDGPPSFPRDFTCPMVLRYPTTESNGFHLRGSHPLRPTFPDRSTIHRFSYSVDPLQKVPSGPTTPQQQRLQPYIATVWALPLSLAATKGVSVDFLSYRYLDVSVPCVVSRLTPGTTP